MKFKKLIIFTLFYILSISFSVSAQSVFIGKVTEVIDGRTAIFTTEKGVRTMILLHNIEVPEPEQELSKIVKEHFGKLSLNKNARFYVGYEYSKGYTGKLFIEDNEINKQMIRDGAAWYNLPENESSSDRGQYLELEIAAKSEKRGVWGVAGLKPAWEFREEKFNKEVEARNLERKNATDKAKANQPTKSIVWGEITSTRTTQSVSSIRNYNGLKNTQSNDAGEALTKYSYDRLHKVAGLGADIADDFATSLNSTTKVYNYKIVKETVDAIEEGIYNIRGRFTKPQNLELLYNIQNIIADINKAFNMMNKYDRVFYREDVIDLANRYNVRPVVGLNGEKVILKQVILSSMFSSMKINFASLQANVSLSTIEQ